MNILVSRVLALGLGLLVGGTSVAGMLYLFQEDRTPQLSDELDTNQSQTEVIASYDPSSRDDSAPTHPPSSIDDLVFPKQTFARKASIVSWISTLSTDELLDWIEQSVETTWHVSSEYRTEFQQMLIEKLVLAAPEAVLKFAIQNGDPMFGGPLINIVFAELAHLDIDSAVVRANELRASQMRNFGLGDIAANAIVATLDDAPLEKVREISTALGNEEFGYFSYFKRYTQRQIENPKETWYELIDLANRENMLNIAGPTLGEVASVWVKEEGLSVLDQVVTSISASSESVATLAAVFRSMRAEDPEAVFEYVMTELADQAATFLEHSAILYSWAQKSPKAVIERAKTLPPSSFREEMFDIATSEWASQTPFQFLDQLEQIPAGQRGMATWTAVHKLVQISPTEIADYILKMSDERVQSSLAQSLVNAWGTEDAEATKAWILRLPDTKPMRAKLVQQYINLIVYEDPKGAFKLALQQPIEYDDGFSSAMESSILNRIAYYDIDVAIELLPQVRDIAKLQAYTDVALTLVHNGEIKRAMDLGDRLSERDSNSFYRNVARSWFANDKQGFLNEFENLTISSSIKSKIALTIVAEYMNNPTASRYSKEQKALLERYLSDEDLELLQQIQEIDRQNPTEKQKELIQKIYGW